MPRLEDDTFKLAWSGELEDLREFVSDRGFTVHVTPIGSGRHARFELHQVTPKLNGNRRVARIGDTVRFDQALLVVDRPKPAAAETAQAPESAALFELEQSPTQDGAVA